MREQNRREFLAKSVAIVGTAVFGGVALAKVNEVSDYALMSRLEVGDWVFSMTQVFKDISDTHYYAQPPGFAASFQGQELCLIGDYTKFVIDHIPWFIALLPNRQWHIDKISNISVETINELTNTIQVNTTNLSDNVKILAVVTALGMYELLQDKQYSLTFNDSFGLEVYKLYCQIKNLKADEGKAVLDFDDATIHLLSC